MRHGRLAGLLVAGMSVLLATAGRTAPVSRAPADQEPRTISVPGEGIATVTPDEVTFSVGLVREGADAKNARLDLTTATRSVLAALKQRGVADADMQTAATSLAPSDRFDGGKRTIAGYRASTVLTVKVRSLEAYDGVLAAAMQAGANEFHGASFGSSGLVTLESQARASAVQDAKRRAETLAGSAGAKVGRILTIAEVQVERPPVPMAAQLRSMGGMRGEPVSTVPSLAGGEIIVRVSIQATWALE